MPISSKKLIGIQLRAAREKAGYTQENVAEKIGISPPHYGKIERGDRAITLEILSKICDLYELPYDAFLACTLKKPYRTSLPEDDVFVNKFATLVAGCPDEFKSMLIDICSSVTLFYKQ